MTVGRDSLQHFPGWSNGRATTTPPNLMNGIESFNPVLMPGIALLVLSTTMRMGNVRASIFELSKSIPDVTACQSCQVFERRMQLLGRALQLLYCALLALMMGSMASFGAAHGQGSLSEVYSVTSPVAFAVLAFAVVLLFLESRSAVQSVLLASRDLREMAARKG